MCPQKRAMCPQNFGFNRMIRDNMQIVGKTESPQTQCLRAFPGGDGGIRTHVGLHPNGFQDRLVMTTSIHLRVKNYKIVGFPKEDLWGHIGDTLQVNSNLVKSAKCCVCWILIEGPERGQPDFKTASL